jgi:hypothetical protein
MSGAFSAYLKLLFRVVSVEGCMIRATVKHQTEGGAPCGTVPGCIQKDRKKIPAEFTAAQGSDAAVAGIYDNG